MSYIETTPKCHLYAEKHRRCFFDTVFASRFQYLQVRWRSFEYSLIVKQICTKQNQNFPCKVYVAKRKTLISQTPFSGIMRIAFIDEITVGRESLCFQ